MSGLRNGHRRRAIPRNGALRLGLMRASRCATAASRVELPLIAQRLVAFLALQARSVRRVFVAGSLWTAPATAAPSSLRSALWRLQRARPGRPGDATTVARSPMASSVDLARRRRALAGADRRPRRALPTSDVLSRTGDLLPDWYEDWVLSSASASASCACTRSRRCQRLTARPAATREALDAGLAAVASSRCARRPPRRDRRPSRGGQRRRGAPASTRSSARCWPTVWGSGPRAGWRS